jgi:DNA-binding response OmpR family regulator
MKTLLVVEDDPGVADMLVRGLRAEGYRVVLATDGESALRAAEAGGFAAMLLDVMLPGDMDGRELCLALRRRRDTTPVLMLTALDALEDRVDGLMIGADDYLVKPFAFEELLARIVALVRRAGGPDRVAARLSLADLVLDRETMVTTLAGRRIDLTDKEMTLLELLMSEPRRVFSRERILAKVWSLHEDPLTNVVDVYIARLRRKLETTEGEAPVITTVRGRGFRIERKADAELGDAR